MGNLSADDKPDVRPSRRRALTIPLPDDKDDIYIKTVVQPEQKGLLQSIFRQPKPTISIKKASQQTRNQRQSPLCRLPYELRLLIWREYLGGHRWHIRRGSKGLRGSECNGDHTVTEIIVVDRSEFTGRVIPSNLKPVGKLSLLQSCRLIYSEAVSVLYTENLFDFEGLDDFDCMKEMIPPHRYNTIRSIKLNLSLEHDMSCKDTYKQLLLNYHSWIERCSSLGRMHGLQNMHLFIHGKQLDKGYDLDAVFQPLILIQARNFRLHLTENARWRMKDIPEDLSNRPGFSIKVMRPSVMRVRHYGISSCCFDGIKIPPSRHGELLGFSACRELSGFSVYAL